MLLGLLLLRRVYLPRRRLCWLWSLFYFNRWLRDLVLCSFHYFFNLFWNFFLFLNFRFIFNLRSSLFFLLNFCDLFLFRFFRNFFFHNLILLLRFSNFILRGFFLNFFCFPFFTFWALISLRRLFGFLETHFWSFIWLLNNFEAGFV